MRQNPGTEHNQDNQPLFEDKKRVLDEINCKFIKKRDEINNQPNILLCGNSGSGKSSLVNAIFGNPHLAQIGIGQSVTKETSRIEGTVDDLDKIKSKRPFVIHDIRGLETGSGETEKFMDDTKLYLKSNMIHVVWFVVSAGQLRFLESDTKLIQLFHRYPVIIVLNKIDQIPRSDSENFEKCIREIIEEQKLKNVRDIIRTTANIFDTDRRTCYIVKECPKCNCKRILIDTFDKEAICTNELCKNVLDVRIEDGLSHLVRATSSILPEVANNIFISEQQVDLGLKDGLARTIIMDSYDKARVDMDSLIESDRVEFIVRLGSIFGMDETGKCFSHKIFEWFQDQLIGTDPTKKMYFKIMDYLEKFFFKMTNCQMMVACEGMFWYFFFRKYYMKHFQLVMSIDSVDNFMIYDRYLNLLSQIGIKDTLDCYFADLQRLEQSPE